MSSGSRDWRSLAVTSVGILGVLLLVAGGLLRIADRNLLDSARFAGRAADCLGDERVAAWVADRVTDAVVAGEEDLILVRPLLEGAAEGVVSSRAFRAAFRASIQRAHQLLITQGGQEVLVSVSDVGVILRETLADRPELAARIPDRVVAVFGRIDTGGMEEIGAAILARGQRVGRVARIAFWAGLVLLAGCVFLAIDQQRALLSAGTTMVGVTLVLIVVLETGGHVLGRVPADPDFGAALVGIWGAFAAAFRGAVFVLGGLGLLLVAASTATLEAMQLDSLSRLLHRGLFAPTARPGLRVARGLVLVGGGILALLNPTITARLVMILAGGALAFLGFRELSRLLVEPPPEPGVPDGALRARPRVSTLRQGVLTAALIVAIGLSAALILVSRDPDSSSPVTFGCNGSDDLCDRPLDQVVFAGTHNSMGAADVPGWMFANHQRGIRTQLEDGIRAFLIDVLPGIPTAGAVKTDIGDVGGLRDQLEPALGHEAFEAAMRIRERLMDEPAGERDLYLCHGLCELGAERLVPVLASMRQFLVLHPREVIVIIVQDAVSPREIERAFEESGFVDLVYRGPVVPPWPTLGEMADRNERVLVLAENDSEGVDWYHPAFEVFQETPYHFTSPEEFDCAPNRGGTGGSLLLVNHWISTPPTSRPSDAAVVNAREALLQRIADCEATRGRLPSVIAVDYYRTGDLLEVVAELNARR